MVLRKLHRPVRRTGFTLMEMLVVVAIIVMLAGVGAWGYMRQLESARESKARIDITHIQQMVEDFKVTEGSYPDSLQILTQPVEGKPAWLEAKDLVDPWGQAYLYEPGNLNPTTLRPRISSSHATSGAPIANW
jgi:general secretion pathway protein G